MPQLLKLCAWVLAAHLLAASASLSVVAAYAEGGILVHRLESGEVSVKFDLPDDVSEIWFYADSSVIRADYWHLETGDLELQSDRIVSSRGTTFKHAAVRLTPNDLPLDRVFPSLVDFGDALSLVNIDYIRARGGVGDMPVVVQNAYDPSSRECLANYSIDTYGRENLPDTAGRYVLLGTSYEDCVLALRADMPNILVSEGTSAKIDDLISGAFGSVYELLLDSFDLSPSMESTIFVSHQPTAAFDRVQADVGWDSVISLRFFGSAWDDPDDARSIQILNLLAHEAVHLWIGTTFQIAGQPGRAWLHEGAAEYIALRILLRQGWMSHEAFRSRIERDLARCSSALGTMSLMTERAPQGGRLVYDCGVLVQFVYDVVIHSESGGQRSVLDLWRELMHESVEAGERTVTAEQFLALNEEARKILSSALYGPSIETAAILESLQEFGVDATLQEDTGTAAIMFALLSGFFTAECGSGPWGFFTLEDHLALDTNETCQTIPDGFVLRHVQGVDVLKDASQVFDRVLEACTQSGVARMSGRTPEEPEFELPCPVPLPESPKQLKVRKLPYL